MSATTAWFGGARHHWVTFETFTEDVERALDEFLATVHDLPGGAAGLLQVQAFVQRLEDRLAVEAGLQRAWHDQRPPVHAFVQPPCSGATVAILCWSAEGPAGAIRRPRPGIAAFLGDDRELTFFDPVRVSGSRESEQMWQECFVRVERRLQDVGLALENLVKTWTLYGNGGSTREHFKAFNAARSKFYAGRTFHLTPTSGAARYPANTGVGTIDPGVAMGFIACRGPVAAIRCLANPSQSSPTAYPKEELATPPLFSRAVSVRTDDAALMLIAGTGSVLGWRTAHPHDAARQARQVADLVAALLRAGDASVADGESSFRHQLHAALVYLARREDIEEAVGATDGLGRTPRLYVEATLSREDLRVEMDGIAIAKSSR